MHKLGVRLDQRADGMPRKKQTNWVPLPVSTVHEDYMRLMAWGLVSQICPRSRPEYFSTKLNAPYSAGRAESNHRKRRRRWHDPHPQEPQWIFRALRSASWGVRTPGPLNEAYIHECGVLHSARVYATDATTQPIGTARALDRTRFQGGAAKSCQGGW